MAKIVVLATGGTIAGQAANPAQVLQYQAAELGVQQILESIEGLPAACNGHTMMAEQVLQIDSKDMDFAHWQTLAQHCAQHLQQADVLGVLVLHGTDTMEETAYFLQEVLAAHPQAAQWQHKPLVLTGAMRPANAAQPDGPANVLDAITVLQQPQAQGVMLVFAGEVHSAQAVRKVQPCHTDAFSSAEQPVLASIAQGHVQWHTAHQWPQVQRPQLWQAIMRQPAVQWPWVELVHSGAGARAEGLYALQQAGVRGVVLVGTGNATLHQCLEQAATQLMAAGVTVVKTTRCLEGDLPQPAATSGVPVVQQGLIPSKARIALLLQLLAAQA